MMDNTAVQTSQPAPRISSDAPADLLPVAPTPSVRRRGSAHWILRTLGQIASLRLTVILFTLSILLVFFGTLAQVDTGVWTVVKQYFRSAFVWVPLQIFFPRSIAVGGGFPFPGGWLLGGVLLLNLLAAHAVRFKMTWKRSGIVLLHTGVIVMMLGELVTGLFAVEGNMTITQGSSTNFVENLGKTELAILMPGKSATDVIVIPQARLQKGAKIQVDGLPFEIQVDQYMVNSQLGRLANAPLELASLVAMEYPMAPAGAVNPASAGIGSTLYIAQEIPEVTGVEDQKIDVPSTYVSIRDVSSGEPLGTFLLSSHLCLYGEQPQFVTVKDKKYEICLRLQRTYKPFSLHLIEFRHDVYLGTDKPKNFSSRVRLVDPTTQEDREVLISMNSPLRYGGETFYQASFRGSTVTVLQVVQNPGWLMPYISCAMVTLGMLIHFLMHLTGFLSRRALA
jgi:hypothetical protein